MAIPEDVAVVRVAWTKHGDEREGEGERAGRAQRGREGRGRQRERAWDVEREDR